MEAVELPINLECLDGRSLVGMYGFVVETSNPLLDTLWLQATDELEADKYGGLMGYVLEGGGDPPSRSIPRAPRASCQSARGPRWPSCGTAGIAPPR